MRKPQLSRQRLHHPIGGEFGPDDRKGDAGRQRVRRRVDGGMAGPAEARPAAPPAASPAAATAAHEVGAQEPVIGLLPPSAAAEQIIVECAGAQFACGKREGARRASSPR